MQVLEIISKCACSSWISLVLSLFTTRGNRDFLKGGDYAQILEEASQKFMKHSTKYLMYPYNHGSCDKRVAPSTIHILA